MNAPLRIGARLLALLAASLLAACGCPEPAAPASASAVPAAEAPARATVLSLCLGETTDARALAPDRRAARDEVLARFLAREAPSVIFLRGLSSRTELTTLREQLSAAGLDYPHSAHLDDESHVCSQGVLSRVPFELRGDSERPAFTVGAGDARMLRGILDVELAATDGTPPLRILAVHLKSKSFHALGQTEFRRNEARILSNNAKKLLAADPDTPLLVLGTLNDTPQSAPLRLLASDKAPPGLADLRPVDDLGASWTRAEPDDTYLRTDYLLASPGFLQAVPSPSVRILSDPDLSAITANRPLLLTLQP